MLFMPKFTTKLQVFNEKAYEAALDSWKNMI